MTTVDWLWIIHPLLAVVLIYPLIGMVMRLGIQTRQRRVDQAKLPATTGREHTDLGQWLSTGVVAISLIALTVAITTHSPLAQFSGGALRASSLLLVLLGTAIALISLWRVQTPPLRLGFALITWLGVLALGSQPEVWRGGDNPFQAEFWQSHYWAGAGVIGLMLFNLGARTEILRQLRWRRIHVTANVLAALLFVILGLTGTRDLLEIPLSWQKSYLGACNWTKLSCPSPATAPKP